MHAAVRAAAVGFRPFFMHGGGLCGGNQLHSSGTWDNGISLQSPVVIVTPRLHYRPNLCMAVPLSMTPPDHPQLFHVKFSKNYHPNEDDDLPVWAKCDLICNVSFRRLDRFKVGPRKYFSPKLSSEDLRSVRAGIICALGFPALTKHI